MKSSYLTAARTTLWVLLFLALRYSINAQAGFTYVMNNGTITVTRYDCSETVVTIPSTINGLPVTAVGTNAFQYCWNVASVTIPNSVTDIYDYAFVGCSSLTNVTIGNSVRNIARGAFYNSALAAVTIPDSVTTIGHAAFGYCANLTDITIPNGVRTIGDFAFASSTNLIYATIGTGVTDIGRYAFGDCTSLTTITIPRSVRTIGDRAFSACPSLMEITVDTLNLFYSSVDGVLFNKSQSRLIQYPGGQAGNYLIPESVVTIADYAFWGTGLTAVTIPDRVRSIGTYAFYLGTSLSSVTMGKGVTSIGDWAFTQCVRLSTLTMGDSVSTIGKYGFSECRSLTSLTIPDNTKSIGYAAFDECTSLTNVTMGNGVTTIGDFAFLACTNLTVVTIPDSVTGIGSAAFAACYSLTNVIIGNGVISISTNAFFSCTRLASAHFRGNSPATGTHVFDNHFNTLPVTVYYLPGTTGWSSTFAGRPTALWRLPYPVILDFGPSFGLRTNRFGFVVSWATNATVAVEACTDLASPDWTPLVTNSLVNGWTYFSDAEWANHQVRFYRVRSP